MFNLLLLRTFEVCNCLSVVHCGLFNQTSQRLLRRLRRAELGQRQTQRKATLWSASCRILCLITVQCSARGSCVGLWGSLSPWELLTSQWQDFVARSSFSPSWSLLG
eukprot:Gregarina_sp_Pseudo_9__874@NODE_155_length_3943_cov_41_170850_g142_i0_p5_GENE_NODE_155_length_3943_cov_41_170850_g142_i0NODE_155_length_3943_cov_41_170850_g142_i0_p5_ORF_typecomplete_len107_score5_65DUF5056/PF16479_5/0_57HECA/PF15353_6/0_62_NODE_155_length_3943_cov_41_170850_g142_i029793299